MKDSSPPTGILRQMEYNFIIWKQLIIPPPQTMIKKVDRERVTTHTLGIGISPLRAKVMAWSEEYPILRMVLT